MSRLRSSKKALRAALDRAGWTTNRAAEAVVFHFKGLPDLHAADRVFRVFEALLRGEKPEGVDPQVVRELAGLAAGLSFLMRFSTEDLRRWIDRDRRST